MAAGRAKAHLLWKTDPAWREAHLARIAATREVLRKRRLDPAWREGRRRQERARISARAAELGPRPHDGPAPDACVRAAQAVVEAHAGRPLPAHLGVRSRGDGDKGRCDRASALLRKIMVTVAVCGLGAPQRGVAAVTGLSHTTIGPFLRDIEDRRDDPGFDALVERLTDDAQARLGAEAAALSADAGGCWRGAAAAVAAWLGAGPAETVGVRSGLAGAERGRCTRAQAMARKLALHVAARGLGASLHGLSAATGLARPTIRTFVAEVEQLRGEPHIIALLANLAAAARRRAALQVVK